MSGKKNPLLLPVQPGEAYEFASDEDEMEFRNSQLVTKLRYFDADGVKHGRAFEFFPTPAQMKQALGEASAAGATLQVVEKVTRVTAVGRDRDRPGGPGFVTERVRGDSHRELLERVLVEVSLLESEG